MSRKIRVECRDATCCINVLEGPVAGMAAGISVTSGEMNVISEFNGEIPAAEEEWLEVCGTSSGIRVVDSSAVDETVCKELPSCDLSETVASTDGQCGVSR